MKQYVMKKISLLVFILSVFLLISSQSVLAASIKVLSPDGGEEWRQNSTREIKWESSGVDRVNIKLKKYNAALPGYIAENIPSFTGSYSWTIPFDVSLGDNMYKIAIYDYSWSSTKDESDDFFSIVAALSPAPPNASPPTISEPSLKSPTDGAVVDTETPTLVWNSVGGAKCYEVEIIELYPSGSKKTKDTSAIIPRDKLQDTGSYTWHVRAFADECDNITNSTVKSSWDKKWNFTIKTPVCDPDPNAPYFSTEKACMDDQKTKCGKCTDKGPFSNTKWCCAEGQIGKGGSQPQPQPQKTCDTEEICIDNPLKAGSIEKIIENIINFIFTIALAVAPLMIIVGAVYYITSAGEPAKLGQAKSIMIYTAIGLAIVLLAKGLVSVIQQVIGG